MKCNVGQRYNKFPSDNEICKSIRNIAHENGLSKDAADVICKVYRYMMDKKLAGGCHAISSVLYVVLKEVGEKPELCIGECQKRGLPPFDHSWVTVNGQILDLAIFMPLDAQMPKGLFGGPIVAGIDVISKRMPYIVYGVNTGLEFDSATNIVIDMPFSEYMTSYPEERNGLWTVVEKVLPSSRNLDITAMKEKYKDVKRVVVR